MDFPPPPTLSTAPSRPSTGVSAPKNLSPVETATLVAEPPVAAAPTPNKATSCFHCRQSHIGCDKQRPCGRCVRLGKECLEFDRSQPRPSLGASNAGSGCQLTILQGGFNGLELPNGLLSFDHVVPHATAFPLSASFLPNGTIPTRPSLANFSAPAQTGYWTPLVDTSAVSSASPVDPADTSDEKKETSHVQMDSLDMIRRSLPCHGCRQAHVACDRARPCARCARQSIPCVDQTNHRLLQKDGSTGFGSARSSARYSMSSMQSSIPSSSLTTYQAGEQGVSSDDWSIGGGVATLGSSVPPIDPRLLYLVGPNGWHNSQTQHIAAVLGQRSLSHSSSFGLGEGQFGFVRGANMACMDSEYFVVKTDKETDCLFAYPTPAVTPPPHHFTVCKDVACQTDYYEPEIGQVLLTSTFVPRLLKVAV